MVVAVQPEAYVVYPWIDKRFRRPGSLLLCFEITNSFLQIVVVDGR